MPRIKADDVREKARGRWDQVFQNLAPVLLEAKRPTAHRPCPVHGGKDGFRLYKDWLHSGGGVCNTCQAKPDGFEILMWVRGWSFPDTLAAVADVLGLSDSGKTWGDGLDNKKPAAPDKGAEPRRGSRVCNFLWQNGLDLRSLTAEHMALAYLRSRTLEDDVILAQRCMRFHAELIYYEGEDRDQKLQLPGLITKFRKKTGEVHTLHRTFLQAPGIKADVSENKKVLPSRDGGTLSGGSVWLEGCSRSTEVDACEGIETGLSIIEVLERPTFAATTAALLGVFDPPDWVTKVNIWADLDHPDPVTGIPPGTAAAEKLARRLRERGIEVEIKMPFVDLSRWEHSVDWNDIKARFGDKGIIAGLKNQPPLVYA